MLSAVSSVSALLGAGARLDNWACWLHHGLTFAALLLCSVVVSARQYAGDPIDCLFRGAGEHKTLDAYCWVQSTFTSARALDPSEERAHPGVGPEAPGEPMRHHAYYRWVCYVLLFQAAASAAPHCLWRAYQGAAVAAATTTKEGLAGAWRLVLHHRGNGALTGWVLLLCEALNFAVDVGQMFFMNLFLDGEFFRHGFEVFPESALGEESREDALARLFPRVTKCSFRQYGPSGDVQTLDGLCVLPINVFNEKVYVALWFWYWLLASVAAINLLYRAALLASPSAREWRLRVGFLCDTDDAQYFARAASFSQFMLAVTLGRQIGGREEFRSILEEVVSNMKKKPDQKANPSSLGDRVKFSGGRGSYWVNCNGTEAGDHGNRCPNGCSELPASGGKQLDGKEPAEVGGSEAPNCCTSHGLEVPARAASNIGCDSAKPADQPSSGGSGLPADRLLQKLDSDGGVHRRCSRGAPDCPSERPRASRTAALRADPGVRVGGGRLAGAEWAWPGGLVFLDDPKQPEAQQPAPDHYLDGGLPSGADLERMGRSVRKCIEKIEKMEISSPSPDKPTAAGAKDKLQKSWLELQPDPQHTVLEPPAAEQEASASGDKDRGSPV